MSFVDGHVAMLYVVVFVFQSCEVMAAASVSRPGSAQTTEKSQLILKGNVLYFRFPRPMTCTNIFEQMNCKSPSKMTSQA